jgi:hypothetical protein
MSAGRAGGRGSGSEGADKPLLDVWFSDAWHGYAVGVFNLLLRTDDGGEHWQPWLDRSDNPQGLHLTRVQAVDGALYITGEQGLLLKLDSDGQRFARAGALRRHLVRCPGQAGCAAGLACAGTCIAATAARIGGSAVQANGSITAASLDAQGASGSPARPASCCSQATTGRFAPVRSPRTPVIGMAFGSEHTLVLVGERGVRRLTLDQPPPPDKRTT